MGNPKAQRRPKSGPKRLKACQECAKSVAGAPGAKTGAPAGRRGRPKTKKTIFSIYNWFRASEFQRRNRNVGDPPFKARRALLAASRCAWRNPEAPETSQKCWAGANFADWGSLNGGKTLRVTSADHRGPLGVTEWRKPNVTGQLCGPQGTTEWRKPNVTGQLCGQNGQPPAL